MRAAALLLILVSSVQAEPRVAKGPRFTVEIPAGYVEEKGFSQGTDVALVAKDAEGRVNRVITFVRTPTPGGFWVDGDPALCMGLANSAAKPDGKVKSAKIIGSPVGLTCQVQVAKQGIDAVMTVLTWPGGAEWLNETWLMVCNFPEGDAASEKTCRALLAAFKFQKL
jgi:hypothetical protein